MKMRIAFSCLTLAILGLLVTLGSALAQDVKGTGKISVAAHEIDFKVGSLYFITVEGKGFQPRVTMKPGNLAYMQPDFNKPNLFRSYYMPNKSAKGTIYVVPEIFNLQGKGPFDYDIEVKASPLAAKPILTAKDELVAADAPFKVDFANRQHHKAYPLKVSAGKFYVIDMKTPAGAGFGGLDPYLYLLDANGKVVMSDDDGGGFPNARIVFHAPKDGDYRLIATGLGNALGKYELTIQTTAK